MFLFAFFTNVENVSTNSFFVERKQNNLEILIQQFIKNPNSFQEKINEKLFDLIKKEVEIEKIENKIKENEEKIKKLELKTEQNKNNELFLLGEDFDFKTLLFNLIEEIRSKKNEEEQEIRTQEEEQINFYKELKKVLCERDKKVNEFFLNRNEVMIRNIILENITLHDIKNLKKRTSFVENEKQQNLLESEGIFKIFLVEKIHKYTQVVSALQKEFDLSSKNKEELEELEEKSRKKLIINKGILNIYLNIYQEYQAENILIYKEYQEENILNINYLEFLIGDKKKQSEEALSSSVSADLISNEIALEEIEILNKILVNLKQKDEIKNKYDSHISHITLLIQESEKRVSVFRQTNTQYNEILKENFKQQYPKWEEELKKLKEINTGNLQTSENLKKANKELESMLDSLTGKNEILLKNKQELLEIKKINEEIAAKKEPNVSHNEHVQQTKAENAEHFDTINDKLEKLEEKMLKKLKEKIDIKNPQEEHTEAPEKIIKSITENKTPETPNKIENLETEITELKEKIKTANETDKVKLEKDLKTKESELNKNNNKENKEWTNGQIAGVVVVVTGIAAGISYATGLFDSLFENDNNSK